MKIDLSCPAEVLSAALPEEERPFAVLTLFNLADRTVVSCEATLRLTDQEGGELARTVHRARALTGRTHTAFRMSVPMEPKAGAVHCEATLDKVWFDDNDVWRRTPGNETEFVSNALPNSNSLNALRFVAGENAVGFPSQQVGLWVCVCGRPNSNRLEICARCQRRKDMIFSRYNRETVEQAVSRRERQLDLQSRSAREEDARLQRLREAEYDLRQRRIARRKRAALAFTAALLLTAAAVFALVPGFRLWSASRAMEDRRYEEAEAVLSALGNFPGAQNLRKENALRTARRDAVESVDPETLRGAAALLRGEGEAIAPSDSGFLVREEEDGAPEPAADSREEDLRLACLADFRRAEILLDAGETDEAEKLLVSLPENQEGRAELLRTITWTRAEAALEQRQYETARALYLSLGSYGDAEEKARRCLYEPALTLMESGAYDQAMALLRQIPDYEDSGELILQCFYLKGFTLENAGDFAAAREAYLAAGDYEDAAEKAKAIRLAEADGLYEIRDYAAALAIYLELDGYENAREKGVACAIALAERSYKDKEYLQAVSVLDGLPEGTETDEITRLRSRALYQAAKAAAKREDYAGALELIRRIPDWQDAASLARTWKYALAQELVKAEQWEEALPLLEELGSYRQSERMLRQVRKALEPPEATAGPEATVQPETPEE